MRFAMLETPMDITALSNTSGMKILPEIRFLSFVFHNFCGRRGEGPGAVGGPAASGSGLRCGSGALAAAAAKIEKKRMVSVSVSVSVSNSVSVSISVSVSVLVSISISISVSTSVSTSLERPAVSSSQHSRYTNFRCRH